MSRKQKAYRAWYHKANAWDMNLQRAFAAGWDAHKGVAHARTIQELEAENDRLRDLAIKLTTMCRAAAEEIAEYWDCHCDEDGYGPVNLVSRLNGRLKPALYPAYKDEAVNAIDAARNNDDT